MSIAAIGLWAVGGVVGGFTGFLISVIGAFYCFPGMHDASHGATYDWVGHVSCIPLLVPYVEFRILHRQHHAHVNDPKLDPDHITQTSPLTWFFIPEIYIYFWAHTSRGRGTVAQRVRGISSYLGMLGLVLLTWWFRGWRVAVLHFFLASRVALMTLVYLLDVLPHRGLKPGPGAHATKDVRSPAPFWFFVLTAGQCYHEMHHANTRIPWHQLRPTI